MFDGFICYEEYFLEIFVIVFGNILYLGGSVGDDLKFEVIYVFYNGEFYWDVVVLLFVGMGKFFIVFFIDYINFFVLKLVVIYVDFELWIVYEINGEFVV